MTVSRLLNELGDGELEYWYGWNESHPLDDGWLQTATIQSALFSTMGGQHISPAQLLPTRENYEKHKDTRAIKNNAIVNALIAKGKKDKADPK